MKVLLTLKIKQTKQKASKEMPLVEKDCGVYILNTYNGRVWRQVNGGSERTKGRGRGGKTDDKKSHSSKTILRRCLQRNIQ